MSEITRHFTATTYVVRGDRVLLHLHPKQRLWLPPGGHIERDELPHHAAIREIEEETGLTLRLHSEQEATRLSAEMVCDVVPQPAFILVEDINPYHQHIDFTYFALTDDASSVEVDDVVRDNGFQWFSPAELTVHDVPQNVRVGSRRAVAFFGESETRVPDYQDDGLPSSSTT